MSEIGVSIVGAAISRPRAETNISHKMLGKLVSLHEIAKPICKYRKLYRTGGRLPPLRQYRVFSHPLFIRFQYKSMPYSKLLAVLYIRVNKFFTEKLALALDEC